MEAGIYSVIEINTIRSIDLTIIVYMYNEQRNTHFITREKGQSP